MRKPMRALFIALCAVALPAGLRTASATAADAAPAPVTPAAAADAAKASAEAAAEAFKKVGDTVKAALEAIEKAETLDDKIAAAQKYDTVFTKAQEAETASKEAGEAAKAAASAKDLVSALKAAATAKDKAAAAEGAVTAAADALSPKISSNADMAWLLTSSAFVMLMVPGLALFYAGMVRGKSVLGTMMHSMVALAIIGVEWVVIGYAMAFGGTKGGFVGFDPALMFLQGVTFDQPFLTISTFVFLMFQGKFAIITPALIAGAIAERVRFLPYCIFILLWGLLCYNPLAHWVWGAGFLGLDGMRAMDFAGGTVVHLSAGVSALAAVLLLGKRRGYPESAVHPHSLVLTLIGAGLLWFGWFGFNGGSALGAGPQAGQAFATTQAAAAMAGLTWMIVEWVHRGKPTSLGLASGIVAGLVGITPAAGFVDLKGALIIGLAVGVVCYLAVYLKSMLGYDDSLDVVGVHGVGGFLGAILTGLLFVTYPFPGDAPGKVAQTIIQLKAAGIAAIYCFVVTSVLVLALEYTIGFRTSEEEEEEGLDISQHGETAYRIN